MSNYTPLLCFYRLGGGSTDQIFRFSFQAIHTCIQSFSSTILGPRTQALQRSARLFHNNVSLDQNSLLWSCLRTSQKHNPRCGFVELLNHLEKDKFIKDSLMWKWKKDTNVCQVDQIVPQSAFGRFRRWCCKSRQYCRHWQHGCAVAGLYDCAERFLILTRSAGCCCLVQEKWK